MTGLADRPAMKAHARAASARFRKRGWRLPRGSNRPMTPARWMAGVA